MLSGTNNLRTENTSHHMNTGGSGAGAGGTTILATGSLATGSQLLRKWKVIIPVLSVLILLLVLNYFQLTLVSYFLLLRETPSHRPSLVYDAGVATDNAHAEGVALWLSKNSSSCDGSFFLRTRSQQADQSYTSPVAIVVRQAVVDWRHVSIQDYKRNIPILARKGFFGGKEFRRVMILMSVIPAPSNENQTIVESASKTFDVKKKRKAALHNADGSIVKDLQVKFDYIIEDNDNCMRHCKQPVCSIDEWQAILTITRAPTKFYKSRSLGTSMEQLADQSAYLVVTFPVIIRATGKMDYVDIKIGLTCIAGLTSHTALPPMPHMPQRTESCDQAHGAVTISGGALFGEKRNSEASWREIAHYAARHLFGHTWYDTVAVALLPDYTLSEIQEICRRDDQNASCIRSHHDANERYMKRVHAVVEDELEAIGVPKIDWSRIVIFLFCHLGTDFNATEIGEPCKLSHHAGQIVLGHFGYAAFAPYHKWASNFDIDEFLVDESAISEPFGSEPRRLESAMSKLGRLRDETGKSHFWSAWLDFRVEEKDARRFTQGVMRGHRSEFRNLNSSNITKMQLEECYDGGGKVAISCDMGASFMIHWGLQVSNFRNLDKMYCSPYRRDGDIPLLYTWHSRNPSRNGNCVYDATLSKRSSGCSMSPRDVCKCQNCSTPKT